MPVVQRKIVKDGKALKIWVIDFYHVYTVPIDCPCAGAKGAACAKCRGSGKITSRRFKILPDPSRGHPNTKTAQEDRERTVRNELEAGTYKQEARLAEEAAAKVEDAKAEKRAEEAKVITFAKFIPDYMERSARIRKNALSSMAVKEYLIRCHLLPFFGDMPLDKIGPAQTEAYVLSKSAPDENGKVQQDRSINNHLIVLRSMIRMAHRNELISNFKPIHAIPVKKRGSEDLRYLTFEEKDRFLNAAPKEWYPLLFIALNTGLRLGELLALKWNNVNIRERYLMVTTTLWEGHEGPPKSGKERKVDLSPAVAEFLAGYRHLRSPYVFCDAENKRLDRAQVKEIVPQTCLAAGLKDAAGKPKRLTFHGMRHTFASHLVMHGIPLVAVQKLLGHSSSRVTEIYSHLEPTVTRSAVAVLDLPAPQAVETEAAKKQTK